MRRSFAEAGAPDVKASFAKEKMEVRASMAALVRTSMAG